MNFPIRIKATAYNYHIAKWVDKYGTQKAAADAIGISANRLNAMMRFREIPRKNTELASIMESVTGVTYEELWPYTKEQGKRLAKARQAERTISLSALENHSRTSQLTYDGDKLMEEEIDMEQFMKNAKKHLSEREFQILTDRYLNHATLEELAKKLQVCVERVRQIEMKAIRKLQCLAMQKSWSNPFTGELGDCRYPDFSEKDEL